MLVVVLLSEYVLAFILPGFFARVYILLDFLFLLYFSIYNVPTMQPLLQKQKRYGLSFRQ
jgi:hypothetical protein